MPTLGRTTLGRFSSTTRLIHSDPVPLAPVLRAFK